MPSVDFHTHILPGIDDGSPSVERSVRMLRAEGEQGIRWVIATPHFYPHRESPQSFLTQRQTAEDRLRAAMADEPGLPRVSVGAEVYFFEGISDCEYLKELAISGTDYVMIEMPMKAWSERNLQELAGIRQKQKLTPIIAHLDRYIKPFQTHRLPERLAEYPFLIQVNADFFTGWSRPLALRLFNRGQIHLLGSDCHDLDHRPPNMNRALSVLERAFGKKALDRIEEFEQIVLGD